MTDQTTGSQEAATTAAPLVPPPPAATVPPLAAPLPSFPTPMVPPAFGPRPQTNVGGAPRSSVGKRFGGYLLEGLLLVVTLGLGWLIWSLIVWNKGQT
ncbi:MAG: hypothetical protein M3Z46_07150, partial [Actinomycetota bacterium]|nr:hypothetical protein [Actinomycetota bacterium]